MSVLRAICLLEEWKLLVHDQHIDAARAVTDHGYGFKFMLFQRDLRLLLGPLSLIVASVRCLSWLLVLRAGIILAGCGARRNAQRDNLHWDCDSHPRPQLANRDILGVLPGVVWLVAIHSLPDDRVLILILLFLRVQHHRRHLRRPRI